MSYQFEVNAGVNGIDQVQRLGAETDKQVDRTKRLDEALQAYLLKNDKLIQSAKSYAEQQARIAQLTEQYQAAQQKKFEAEERGWRSIQAAQDAAIKTNQKLADDAVKNAEKAQRANEQLGASVKNWIQNPLGAAGDAAEKFALQYGAMGVAGVGAAVALGAGAIAAVSAANATGKYAQEVSNLASRTGLTTTETQLFTRASELAGVNAGTLTTAMRTLSRGMSENTDEGKKQKQVLAELGFGMDAAYRPMGELLPEIFAKLAAVSSAMERDRMTITLLGRSGLEMEPLFDHFKELESRVAATGVVIDEKGIAKAKAYREEVILLGLQWDAVKLKLGQNAIGFIDFFVRPHEVNLSQWLANLNPVLGWKQAAQDSTTTPPVPMPKPPGARPPEDLQNEANQQALEKYESGRVSKLGREAVLQEEQKKDAAKRAEAETAVSSAKSGADSATAVKSLADIDQRIEARKKELEVIRKSAGLLERMEELDKRSHEIYAKSLQDGEPTARRNYDDKLTTINASRSDALRKDPTRGAGINADYDLQAKAAFYDFLHAITGEMNKTRDELLNRSATGESEESLAALKQQLKKSENDAKMLLERSDLLPSFPSIGITPEHQLREAHSQGAADLRALSASSRTSGVNDPDATYDVRMNNMARELAAELRIADLKKTESEKEEARLDAIDKAKELYYQAEEDRQESLAAAAEAQADAFAKGMTGLLAAGRAKGGIGVQNYFKSYAEQMEDTVLGNAAKAAWTGGIGSVANKFRATDSDSWFGKLAKGTPFGADPAATETLHNTNATVDNTAATKLVSDALTKYLQTVPGSATYNPSAQAAAISQYNDATGAYSPASGGYSPVAGASSMAALTSDSTAVASAVQRVMSGASSSPSDLAIFKSVASGVGGVGRLVTALSSSSASGSSSASSGYNVVGSPILGNDPEAGQVQMGNAIPGSPVYGEDSVWAGDSYNPAFDAAGNGMPMQSTSGRISTGQGIGMGAGAAAAAFSAYSGFKAGGAQGDLQGASSILGAASLIPGPQQPFIAAGAAITAMVASLIGDPKTNREKAIQKDLKYNQFMAPVSLNESMSTNGTYLDSNMFGGVRTSSLSPNEVVQQGYYDYKHNTTVPGQVVSSFSYGNAPNGSSGGAPQTVINNNISAMDGEDVARVFNRHMPAIGDALNRGLMTGTAGTGLQDTISRL